MNDWTLGLGSYEESKEKFPHGLKNLSDAVHAEGLKFGIWIDPGMSTPREWNRVRFRKNGSR